MIAPSDPLAEKKLAIFLSSHSTSSLLSPGPPAQSAISISQNTRYLEGACTLTTPDRRENIELSNSWLHASNFILRIFGSNECKSLAILLIERCVFVLRKIKISLPRQDECFSFDGSHGFLEITVVWLLLRNISVLPGSDHR